MGEGIWQEIETLRQKFVKLSIGEAVDYEKYYLYSLIAHSTAIEGSTLTETEVQLLFDEGVAAGGKPLVYHLMDENLKNAYEPAKKEAKRKTPITSSFLQILNAALMRTTGSVHNVMGGSFDSSKGEYRLNGVTAGIGGRSYMNYQKVPTKVAELCNRLQERINAAYTVREQYELRFNVHLNLVTIQPWVNGNGRTFPTKIFKEDKDEYILALRQSQKKDSNLPFLAFMASRLKKSLSLEIEWFNTSQKRGFNFLF